MYVVRDDRCARHKRLSMPKRMLRSARFLLNESYMFRHGLRVRFCDEKPVCIDESNHGLSSRKSGLKAVSRNSRLSFFLSFRRRHHTTWRKSVIFLFLSPNLAYHSGKHNCSVAASKHLVQNDFLTFPYGVGPGVECATQKSLPFKSKKREKTRNKTLDTLIVSSRS